MRYLYYPGCSMRGAGRPYEESLRAVFQALEIPLEEIDDWNCCGATAYMSVDETQAFALAARNLALAERQSGAGSRPNATKVASPGHNALTPPRGYLSFLQRSHGLRHGLTSIAPSELCERQNESSVASGSSLGFSVVAPCSACYMVLLKTQDYLQIYPDVRQAVESGLKEAGLSYSGAGHVRHPLDVLVNDVGLDRIRQHVKRPLKGLKVACYYGCQIVRPFETFDSCRNPHTMEKLVKALGGERRGMAAQDAMLRRRADRHRPRGRPPAELHPAEGSGEARAPK